MRQSTGKRRWAPSTRPVPAASPVSAAGQSSLNQSRTDRPNISSEALLRPALLLVPWSGVSLLLLGWLLFPAALTQVMFVPLLLSVVLFGLPHGALDHLVPRLLHWRWAGPKRNLALYLLLYAGLAFALLLSWHLAPPLALWGFLVASLLHWGQGDLHFLEAVLGRTRRYWWSAPVAVLARGSLPIVVSLLAFPDWFTRLSQGASRAFGTQVLPGELLSGPGAAALLTALVAVLLLYVFDTAQASAQPMTELGEAALLLALFVTVPPPLALGLYFTLWHAWRHLGRLLALSAEHLAPAPTQPRLSWRFVALALPITGLALLLLAGLYLWAAPRVHDTETLVALYLALIAALTGPHALLVAAMDFRGAPSRNAVS
ncbi:Brp/Blh family beta-carotene 15,15'-dioxygenase [Deinococcus sp.]|uniref:Brp/Blh family beta-carotene 15,15'-dioxygenase n=1 Tax=Deinococcus sp. TaxID=47478 RepID=UPI0025F272EE|nr:Brp/Blh family beta-carotene 15,15'-dioxygenase [Deinococcus sp.]